MRLWWLLWPDNSYTDTVYRIDLQSAIDYITHILRPILILWTIRLKSRIPDDRWNLPRESKKTWGPLNIMSLAYPKYITTKPAMPASPIASNYPLNEQWAPLAVYGKRAPLRRKLRGQHKHAQRNAMKTNSRKWQTAHARPLLELASFSQLVLVLDL